MTSGPVCHLSRALFSPPSCFLFPNGTCGLRCVRFSVLGGSFSFPLFCSLSENWYSRSQQLFGSWTEADFLLVLSIFNISKTLCCVWTKFSLKSFKLSCELCQEKESHWNSKHLLLKVWCMGWRISALGGLLEMLRPLGLVTAQVCIHVTRENYLTNSDKLKSLANPTGCACGHGS